MAIGTPVLGTPTEDSAATTSRNVAWPSPINNGDVAVLVGVNGSASNTAVTTPTGFTAIAQLSGTGNTATPAVYMARHTCDGTETGNLAVSTPGGSGVQATFALIIFPGVVNGSGGLDVAFVPDDKTTASSAIAFTSGITTLTDGDTLLYVVAGNSTSITATPMTGFTEAFDRIAAGRRGWEVGYRQGLAAGAYTPSGGTWSGSTKDVGILVALKPAPVTYPVTGTVAATSAGSGAVTSTLGVTGSVAGISAASGAITATHGVTGSVAGTSGATGTVTATFGVSGTVAAQATAAGSIASILAVLGTVAGTSGGSGGLTATYAVTGRVDGVSGASGSVTIAVPPRNVTLTVTEHHRTLTVTGHGRSIQATGHQATLTATDRS